MPLTGRFAPPWPFDSMAEHDEYWGALRAKVKAFQDDVRAGRAPRQPGPGVYLIDPPSLLASTARWWSYTEDLRQSLRADRDSAQLKRHFLRALEEIAARQFQTWRTTPPNSDDFPNLVVWTYRE